MILSGCIGIALGDTFYISALKLLGTRKTLTVEALTPIIAGFIGLIFLHESLSIRAWIGVVIVSFSLIVIIQEKNLPVEERITYKGYIFASLSVLCAVCAATLSRIVLINSEFNPFQTTTIRLFGAIAVLTPFVRIPINKYKDLLCKKLYPLFFATLLGTNLGILLQQFVFQILPIAIGWTLLSISPILSLFFAKWESEELTFKTYLFTFSMFFGIILVVI